MLENELSDEEKIAYGIPTNVKAYWKEGEGPISSMGTKRGPTIVVVPRGYVKQIDCTIKLVLKE